MYHAIFVIFFYFSLLPVIAGVVLPQPDLGVAQEVVRDRYEYICPDGLPGLVTQTQYARLDPFQPDIYITDCSPTRNTTNTTSINKNTEVPIHKRQEQICPADCSNSCSSGAITPSSSDCNALVTYLNNRNSQWTVASDGIHTETSGTCTFQVVNMVDSPFIYCDTALANRGNSVVSQCPTGGQCQGSRFYAKVLGNAASSGGTSAAQTSASPAASQGTSSNGSNTGNSGSNSGSSDSNSGSNNGSSGNGSSSNNGNGLTTANAGNAATTITVANGSTQVISNSAPGSVLGAGGTMTAGNVVHSVVPTTLSNGQVMSVTGGVIIPTGDAQSATTGSRSSSGSSNIPAIVGGILGALAVIALIVAFLFWRRKRRRQQEKLNSDEHLPCEDHRPETIFSDINSAPTDIAQAPMAEVPIVHGWATSTKARMIEEDSQRHGRGPNVPSSVTSSNPRSGSSATESSILPYRSRSGRRGHHHSRTGSNRTDPHDPHRHRHREGSVTATSDTYSSITGSSQLSQAATLARAAGPSLSAVDIDRLAANIVSRMQGRNPGAHSSAVMEEDEDEDEPPPPWSAPEHDQNDHQHAPQP